MMHVSKHALNRIVERVVICQNIKPNKKQIKHNKKKVMKKMKEDMNNYVAYSIGSDSYVYYYTGLDKKGLCKKYICNSADNTIITVIKDIDINKEAKKYNLKLNSCGFSQRKIENYLVSNYIYATINGFNCLFVVNKNSNKLFTYKYIEGKISC